MSFLPPTTPSSASQPDLTFIDPSPPPSTQAAQLAFEHGLDEFTFSEHLGSQYVTHLSRRKLKVEQGHDRTYILPSWFHRVILSARLKTKRQIEAELDAEQLVWQNMEMASEDDDDSEDGTGEDDAESEAGDGGGQGFSTMGIGSGAELDADAMITEQGDFWEEDEDEEDEEIMD